MDKRARARLPQNAEEANAWAVQREQWAAEARDRDMLGSALEFELTAMLLRWFSGSKVFVEIIGDGHDGPEAR